MTIEEEKFVCWIIEQIKKNSFYESKDCGFNRQYILPDILELNFYHIGSLKIVIKKDIEIIVEKRNGYYYVIRNEIAKMLARNQKLKDEKLRKLLITLNKEKG